ncbi:MAG TPA: phosphatase PAP2 family protein [Candidatus Magasanikbacteria bacterium]|nr:phosphatase PAP2 family protein [Candidatus Magasanikbacteria bacterium]
MILDSLFASNTIVNLDKSVNSFFLQIRDEGVIKLLSVITEIGEVKIVLGLALLLSVFFWWKQKKWSLIGMWSALVGSMVVTYLAKIYFDRPRPLNAAILETSGSFPSGHATVAIAFYGYLAYLLFKNTKNILYRFLIVFSAIIVALVIGFSRLYLGVHYLSDVGVGYLVGFAGLAVSIFIVGRSSKIKLWFIHRFFDRE